MEERIRVIKKRERRRTPSSLTAWRPESVGGVKGRRRRRLGFPRGEAGLKAVRQSRRRGRGRVNVGAVLLGFLILLVAFVLMILILILTHDKDGESIWKWSDRASWDKRSSEVAAMVTEPTIAAGPIVR